MKEIAIKLKNVSKRFIDREVLKNISLEIPKGDSFVLIGKSGNGKSVLLKSIIGVLQPEAGEIFLNGVNVSKLNQAKRISFNREIGVLFQGSALFDSLNILQNVVFGVNVHRQLTLAEAKKLAIENLELVGLNESVLYLYPAELSGGMQKRVAIARQIAPDPKILFFDEPTSGLDPEMSDTINNLIVNTAKHLEATSFIITHDMVSAKRIANHIALIESGEIVWQGKPEELKKSNHTTIINFNKYHN